MTDAMTCAESAPLVVDALCISSFDVLKGGLWSRGAIYVTIKPYGPLFSLEIGLNNY